MRMETAENVLCTCVSTALLSWITHAHFVMLSSVETVLIPSTSGAPIILPGEDAEKLVPFFFFFFFFFFSTGPFCKIVSVYINP